MPPPTLILCWLAFTSLCLWPRWLPAGGGHLPPQCDWSNTLEMTQSPLAQKAAGNGGSDGAGIAAARRLTVVRLDVGEAAGLEDADVLARAVGPRDVVQGAVVGGEQRLVAGPRSQQAEQRGRALLGRQLTRTVLCAATQGFPALPTMSHGPSAAAAAVRSVAAESIVWTVLQRRAKSDCRAALQAQTLTTMTMELKRLEDAVEMLPSCRQWRPVR